MLFLSIKCSQREEFKWNIVAGYPGLSAALKFTWLLKQCILYTVDFSSTETFFWKHFKRVWTCVFSSNCVLLEMSMQHRNGSSHVDKLINFFKNQCKAISK